MNALWELLVSPLGPAIVLVAGSFVVFAAGRWLHRSDWQSGIALLFWGVAFWQTLGLRLQPVVPLYSRPWQPFLLQGTHLLWIGDGWNWYVAVLVLLLGGVALLLSGFGGQYVDTPSPKEAQRSALALPIHLGVLATALLFVGSGNLLTATLTWVLMDVFLLARSAIYPGALLDEGQANYAHGLSLLGALLLLIGLLPAGPGGPGQPLQGGDLPVETVVLLLVASAIRAGAYPFHLWLLPANSVRMGLPERLRDHMIPALCGLWLLGWTIDLGAEYLVFSPEVLSAVLLALLGSAIAAVTATEQPGHTTFVLITSAGLAGLVGALAGPQGPTALIWPTTTFALGGALWLVGERVWREWGWQIPVSVGALALVGAPFTPGFLSQPFLARLAVLDSPFLPLFLVYVVAQTLQVAALLRSWGAQQRRAVGLASPVIQRLLIASVVLALPLVLVGIYPQTVAVLASMPDGIPSMLGNPPSAVAEPVVWLTLGLPLLSGIAVAVVRPRFWSYLGNWPDRFCRLAGLEWLARLSQWGAQRASALWLNATSVVEGAGYMGWLLVFVLISYLLLR